MSQLQNNIQNLQSILEQVNSLPDASADGTNSFPYKITWNCYTNGQLDNDILPIICYGDNNNTIIILSRRNSGGAYSATWQCTNCERFFSTNLAMGGEEGGEFAIFTNFTGDAIIELYLALNGAYD